MNHSKAINGCCRALFLAIVTCLTANSSGWLAAAERWTAKKDDANSSLEIQLHGRPFVTYQFRDPAISRPYFANVFAPNGVKITRNHPPAPDDLQDHEDLHPGLWMAFGDLSGADSWRLKAPVEHIAFVEAPHDQSGVFDFTVENRYLHADKQREVCREVVRYRFHELPHGVLLDWDSTFQSADADITFGDQEELGVGVRLARQIAVVSKQGGRILNSNGEMNEKGFEGKPGVWGKQADWCDYSGTINGHFVGAMLAPHPSNFRRSWSHARDTGFVALNPFGINAFTKQPKKEWVVPRGTAFRLRYGVLFHWHEQADAFDPAAEYKQCLQRMDSSVSK
ncbi:MAG: PmoA family protein [Planctomycetota bacterium]|nr:PmoA family protein [Planctomycetota bacterium]